MAVEIVKSGDQSAGRSCKGRCEDCGCEYRCLASDCRRHEADGSTLVMDCPECGARTFPKPVE